MSDGETESDEQVLYLDTSAVLRAVLEPGTSPDVDRAIGTATYIITSRLSIAESARATLRLRARGLAERDIVDCAREIDSIWARCTIWEMTRSVMDLAGEVAPRLNLRTLDAIHLATFLTARRRIGAEVTLITCDRRLEEAATSAAI